MIEWERVCNRDEEEDEKRSNLGVQEDEQENGRGTSQGVMADKQNDGQETSLAVVEDEPKSVWGSQSSNMIHDPVSLARGKSLNRYNQTPFSQGQNSFCSKS
jgi:hypothetical protein